MRTTYHKIHSKKIIQKHQRDLRTLFFDQPANLLNFASTDFLGMLSRRFVQERAIEYAMEWGTGCSPFRHLEEFHKKHQETQECLGALLAQKETLLLESEPHLFSNFIQSLLIPSTLILKDQNFSRSLKVRAPIQTFPANQIKLLQNLLITNKHRNLLILLDSLSLSYPNAPELGEWSQLAHGYNATLIVDDSQCFGILGKHGMGLTGTLSGADFIFGSFGKNYGAYASFIATNPEWKTYLGNQSPFLQTFSLLPPLLLGLVDASLTLIPSMSVERAELLNRAKDLRLEMKKLRHAVKDSHANSLSLLFKHPSELYAFKKHLTDHQCIPFHPPSQLELTFYLNTSHTESDIAKLLQIAKSHYHIIKSDFAS